MDDLRRRLLELYGSHPRFPIIRQEISDIVARIEDAYERMERVKFQKAFKELRCYKPPEID